MLEQLEAANLFLVALDHRRVWYRYHGLFREVLRLELTRDDQAALHGRAADWYREQGAEDAAAQHARLAAQLAGEPPAPPRRITIPQPLIEPLSERELQVLGLIASGLSNREIAHRLYIATGTVKRHTNNIYGKLGVQSRTQAVARARNLELI